MLRIRRIGTHDRVSYFIQKLVNYLKDNISNDVYKYITNSN